MKHSRFDRFRITHVLNPFAIKTSFAKYSLLTWYFEGPQVGIFVASHSPIALIMKEKPNKAGSVGKFKMAAFK